jgi:hypothetical protein
MVTHEYVPIWEVHGLQCASVGHTVWDRDEAGLGWSIGMVLTVNYVRSSHWTPSRCIALAHGQPWKHACTQQHLCTHMLVTTANVSTCMASLSLHEHSMHRQDHLEEWVDCFSTASNGKIKAPSTVGLLAVGKSPLPICPPHPFIPSW